MAAMYAVYHGPIGLRNIACKVHGLTQVLSNAIGHFGYRTVNQAFFDTLTVDVSGTGKSSDHVHNAANAVHINLRRIDDRHVGVTLDESVGPKNIVSLVNVFTSAVSASPLSLADLNLSKTPSIPPALQRTSQILPHPVFNKHHSETELLRYIHHLASKDIGLVHSMIPLGSCTMKLNSTSSMIPVTLPEFGTVHPFVPADQVTGYLGTGERLMQDHWIPRMLLTAQLWSSRGVCWTLCYSSLSAVERRGSS
jgi:glycine dehydrogenase